MAQALASALKVLRKMGSVDKFVANSALRLGANWVPLLKRAGMNCIKKGLPGKLILSKRKGLWEVLFS